MVLRADSETGDRELVLMRWGLIPSWATDTRIGSRLINARSETAAEKPSFRAAYKRRRCLVIADGFYEWKKNGRSKQPYLIQMKSLRPFAFAGLWEIREKSESRIESCAILTTTPNSLMTDIHDRMPVILSDESADLWLDHQIEQPTVLSSLLVPFPAAEMEAIPVSSLVNSPCNESPHCVVPLES